jgi:DNA-binding HxlR family transcriptional regulator
MMWMNSWTACAATQIARCRRWKYAHEMARTHEKVRYSPEGKDREYTPVTAASGVEQAFKILEGRWKLVILFHLFGGKMLRFSELERAIPTISQKMLIQQLRQMENDGVVRRIVHLQVPPKVEYGLTDWGQALCPTLDALLKWAALRDENADAAG